MSTRLWAAVALATGLVGIGLPPGGGPGPVAPRGLAAGCSAWPGETIHTDRPPREPPLPTPVATGGVEGSGDVLASDAGAFPNGPPDLTGTWAQLQITSSVAHAPLVGEIHSTTSTLARLELTQTGQALTGTSVVCDIQVESDGGLQTRIPPAFIAAIAPAVLTGRVMPTATGYAFHLDRQVQLLGAALASPATDPLPTEADDPTVRDPDGDGHPGMTILLEGFVSGAIYVAQRVSRVLDGVVRNPDEIDGRIDWRIDQVTLGASSFMLNTDTQPQADPDEAHNRFRTTRVDAAVGCPEIVQARGALFHR